MPTLTLPLSRIEGHAQVVIEVHDGAVVSAHFQAMSFRGFEHFVQGVPAEQMPIIVPRICGVCSTAHHVAAVMALEDAFGVRPPALARTIRELLLLGQLVQNQATSLFFFTLPDRLGLESLLQTAGRLELEEQRARLAPAALGVRKVGTHLISLAGGQFIHPVKAVVGGVTSGIPAEAAAAMRAEVLDTLPRALALVDHYWQIALTLQDAAPPTASPPTCCYLTATTDPCPVWCGPEIRVMDASGAHRDAFAASEHAEHLLIEPTEYSYSDRSTWHGEVLRANSLARVNMTSHLGTPHADAYLERFREAFGAPAHDIQLYDLARSIELVYGLERASELLAEPLDYEDTDVPWELRDGEGFGLVEAPRGPLVHHYVVEGGAIQSADFIIPTVHNVASIERELKRVAAQHVDAERIDLALERAVGMVVRAFDPCIACATH